MMTSEAPPVPAATQNTPKRQRIAKMMARAGLCSRRDAEAWILEGRVSVNGTILTSPAIDVAADDAILVDGMPLPAAEKTRLFLFHKPRGLVTSDHDPEGRATVIDYLRENWPEGPRVVTIGRLDINTEGLLLLTNDGGLARVLELPQTGWVRRYRVRAKGSADPAALDALAAGLTIDGIDYAGIEAKLDRVQGANCWLTMGLREGKNREVKRVLEHIGLEVNRLIRLSFGPFQLLDLPEGAVEEVRTRILRDQLGESLARQADVDLGELEPQERPPRDQRPVRMSQEGRKAAPRARDAPPSRARRPEHARGVRPPDERDDSPAPASRERPVAGARKHVSRLRAAETEASRGGPRKRIERSDTQDRRDRTIRVERLVSTRGDDHRVAPRQGGPRDTGKRDPTPRNAAPKGDRPRPKSRSGSMETSRYRPADGRDRPAHREARAPGQSSRDGDQRDRPRADGASERRRHASPSALGKRERMTRSGAAQGKGRDRAAPDERQGRRTRPTGEGFVRERSSREGFARERSRSEGPAHVRGEKRAARSDSEAGRAKPRGAGSRRPSGQGGPRGKPPRGPSKPKR